MNAALRAVDRLFRVSGIVTLIALAATIAMLITGIATWWMPFVAAHLTALIALLPLGLVLIAYGYREAGGVAPMIARHGIVAAALAVIAVSVTVTLLEFSTNRDVRRVANIVTVSLVVLLVVHYLRWSRQALRG